MLNKYSQKLLLSFALVALGTLLHAQGKQSMSLNDCIQYALENQPEIKIAQLQLVEAEWRIKENTATGLPNISGGINYQYFIQRPGIPASALGFGTGEDKIVFSSVHSLTPDISLNQLFFSNSYRIATKAARYYKEYVTQQLVAARQTIRNRVIDAYLPALLITENVSIIDKNIGNIQKLYDETKAIKNAGFAEELDVDRLDLTLSNLRSERINLVRQQEIVLNALKFTMGMSVTDPITLTDNLNNLLTEFASIDTTAELNLMNRQEYVQLLKGREVSRLQIDLNSKTWMPTVAGFITYQPAFQGGFGNKTAWYFIPSSVAGVSVSFSIWDGGVSKARRERAIVGVQTLDQQERQLRDAITLEYENASAQYLNVKERVANQQQNLALAEKIFNTTQIKYKSGVGSSFEITQSESQLFLAQQRLLQAQYDLLAAKVGIKKALGQ